MKNALSYVLTLCLIILTNSVFASETTQDAIYITTEKIEITEGMVSHDIIEEEEIITNPNRNIGDLTKYLPNVERAGSLRGSNSEFKIRGMEDTRIVTKIDGAKTNFRAEYKGRNFLSPYLLSSISVIRGSNSVMEGSGSIAGSVDLRTKEVEDIALNPMANKGAELFSSYSSNGNLQDYGGATFVRKNGYSLLALYDFTKNNNFKVAEDVNIGTPNEPNYTNSIPFTGNETNNGMLKFKKQFNNSEYVKLSASFFNEKGENTTNPFRVMYAGDPVNKNLINYRTQGELELEKFNLKAFYETTNIEETRIKDGRFDKTNGSSYGLNTYGRFKYQTKRVENIVFYGLELIETTQSGTRANNRDSLYPKGNETNEGIYLENALRYGNFKLLLGARQDYFQTKADGQSNNYTSSPLKKAVISYEIANVFTPFFRYSEGYRAPLIKETFASGNILTIEGKKPFGKNTLELNLLANPNLRPEYSQNYETGFKFLKEDWFEAFSETSLNFTYFIQDVSDFIIQDPKCTTSTCRDYPTLIVFQYQNLNKVRFDGVEAELKYSSNKYLLSVAVSTLRAEEKSNGNKILQTPNSKLILKAVRKFESGISIGVENISASGVNRFRNNSFSSQNFIGKPPFWVNGVYNPDSKTLMLAEQTKGYSITNFNLDYTRKKSNYESLIGVSLENVFNVYYKEQTSYIPGLGRTINVYAKIKF
jgi:hemoglobin/transferrin/lactoferrin receptor protein